MKAVLLIFWMIGFPLIVVSHEECRFYEFLQFKYTYNFTYANASEEYKRCLIFTANLESIEEHNRLYKAGKIPYYQGTNQFSALSRREFIEIYASGVPPVSNTTTTPRPNSHLREHRRSKRAAATWAVPTTFTANNNVNLTVASIPVRNQKSCGSCWAFAAAGILEYGLYKKFLMSYDLSEQNFVDCVTASFKCNGGYVYTALDYYLNNGADFETIYPYTALNGTCAYKTTTITTNGVPKANLNWYTFPQTELALAYAVSTYGWVAVAVNANAFQSYKGGILPATSCSTGPNHAVIVVGYGTDPVTKTPYWIIRNSWGATWGERGYIRIERSKNACDIMYQWAGYRTYVA